MDPRNPLGRLERLGRDPNVAELSLSFEHRGDTVVRKLRLSTRDGRERRLVMREGWSWVDLLDRVQQFVEDEA